MSHLTRAATARGAPCSGAPCSGAPYSGAPYSGTPYSGAPYSGAFPSVDPGAVVDPSAIVDAGAVLGPGTRVWHFSHICGGAHIGSACSLGQNVFVGNDVRIGDRVKIQNNVSVYDAVTIEDEVFCGPSMVFTNVHNPRAAVVRKDQYRRTIVRRGASIGANATIVCGVTIGQYAFVGAGAVVTRDVPAFALMAGVPARQIGWISRHGERLALPLSGTGQAECPQTGDFYSVCGNVCTLFRPVHKSAGAAHASSGTAGQSESSRASGTAPSQSCPDNDRKR